MSVIDLKEGRIELLMLKELAMEERWTMGLEEFLTKMFPNVENLDDDLLGGRITLIGLIKTIKDMLRHKIKTVADGSAVTLGGRGNGAPSRSRFGKCKTTQISFLSGFTLSVLLLTMSAPFILYPLPSQ